MLTLGDQVQSGIVVVFGFLASFKVGHRNTNPQAENGF
jgi:hypothetical protein